MKRDPLRPVLAVVPLGPGRGRARAGYRQRAPEQPELPVALRYRLRPHLPGRCLPETHNLPGHGQLSSMVAVIFLHCNPPPLAKNRECHDNR